ncbi:hypothetical protein HDU90_006340 [Geranomyces variabilis]|nr:hypothetical protein HDU90_006340 [Geranomyces variabilis]
MRVLVVHILATQLAYLIQEQELITHSTSPIYDEAAQPEDPEEPEPTVAYNDLLLTVAARAGRLDAAATIVFHASLDRTLL